MKFTPEEIEQQRERLECFDNTVFTFPTEKRTDIGNVWHLALVVLPAALVEIERLREALEWYAKLHWTAYDSNGETSSDIGRVARVALKGDA